MKNEPAPHAMRTLVADFVARHGVVTAAKHLGISRLTLGNIMAGLDVQQKTIAQVQQKLNERYGS